MHSGLRLPTFQEVCNCFKP